MAEAQSPLKNTEGVWRALAGGLRAFIARRVEGPADVDELLKETFLQVHEHLGAVRDEERLTSWIYQEASSCVAEHHRKRQSSALMFDVAVEPVSDDGEQVRREVASWMVPFVEALPDNYREAVRLSELEGVTQPEIAEHLNLSLSGAKSRIQRGRQRLLELVDACCEIELDAGRKSEGYSRRRTKYDG